MKRLVLLVFLVFLALGCSPSTITPPLSLVGTLDMVLVDQLPGDGSVASVSNGIPNEYLFVTSAETNELKVLRNYVSGSLVRSPATAPDPLETLSIPVLNRPSTLFADEGVSTDVRRVTGRFVYATRAGGAELSVVDAAPTGFVQVTKSPLVMPAPITAAAAWLGIGLTTLPDSTSVYVATFDGSNGTVYVLTLPNDPARRGEIAAVTPKRVLDVGQEAVVALAMVPALPGRTFDGQPFCAGPSSCLVLATRRNSGKEGRTLMVELDTLRTATLAFPGPVRVLRVAVSAAGLGQRIHGLLDEEKCDSVSCGGALVIDTLTGTSSGGFPVLTDFSGQPMLSVVRSGALPRDLAVASAHIITDSSLESPLGLKQYDPTQDAGVVQQYTEMGVFSASNGEFITYDGVGGVPLDYLGTRSGLATTSLVRIPGGLPDGGVGFYTDDGGTNYEEIAISLTEEDTTAADGSPLAYRSYSASASSSLTSYSGQFHVVVGDGYLFTQAISVINQGAITGLVGLGTSSADLQTVRFNAGLEARLAVGDRVDFSVTQPDGGVEVCGASHVSGLGAGVAQLDAIPSGCEERSVFTIMGGGAQPNIVSGEIEGYVGRGAEGETVTYNRRYVVRPTGFDMVRPALVLTIGTMPAVPGAYWLFNVDGFISPYRIRFDFSTVSNTAMASCLTEVPGAVLLAEVPTNSASSGFTYPWELLTLFPYPNGIAMEPLDSATSVPIAVDPLTYGAACYR